MLAGSFVHNSLRNLSHVASGHVGREVVVEHSHGEEGAGVAEMAQSAVFVTNDGKCIALYWWPAPDRPATARACRRSTRAVQCAGQNRLGLETVHDVAGSGSSEITESLVEVLDQLTRASLGGISA